MSFMGVAVGMGASGIGAAMLAGGMMGGATTFGMNILSGRDAFSNMGQGMLMGAAGSGLVSGLGSLAGGATEATQATQQLAARDAQEIAREAATQQSLAPGMSQYSDVSKFVNPPAMSTPSMASLEPSQYQQIGNANAFDPHTSGGLNPANNGVGGVGTVASAPPTPPIASAPPDVSQFTQSQPIKPAEFMKNPADYMVQNPSKVAGVGAALNTMLNPQQPGIANPLTDKTGYSPKFTWDQKTQKYVSAAPAPYTYKGAEGGEIRGYKAGGPYKEVTPGPYKEGVSGPIYGEDTSLSSKKGPYEDTDMYSSIKSKIERMSPSMLDRLSKGAKDPIVQAAATTELYDRSNSVNSYISQPTTQAAKGGIMSLENSYAAGGDTTSKYSYDPSNQTYTPPSQPQAAVNIGDIPFGDFGNIQNFITAPSPQKYSYDPKQQQYTKMAQGGVASLGGDYAAGGKLLQGPGDGMSDSIPAVIQGAKPQRAALAQGEFVVPADVVSHLGNGSTDAGAKRLYAMMDKIRHARTGNKKQGKQINPNNFLPV
jgi:hypothetical protein